MNQCYHQLLSEYGRDFRDRIIAAIQNRDRVQCLAYAFQFSEWITSVLTNQQFSKPTVSQRLFGLDGPKDYQSKEGNVMTPQQLLRVYPGMDALLGEIHVIRKQNIRRPDVQFLPDIITDLVAVVESQNDDPVTTLEDARRYVDAHNYAVQSQNRFHAEEEMDMVRAYEQAERSEFFTLSAPAQLTLSALVYLSNTSDDFTAGQVAQFAGLSRSEIDDSIDELMERDFIDRSSGSRFSNTRIYVDNLSEDFVSQFVNIPSSELSDLDWKEAVLYATLCEQIGQEGGFIKTMMNGLVLDAFRGRYSGSSGVISAALRTLEMRGFIGLDRSTSPFRFTIEEFHSPEEVFSSLPADEIYEVANILRREPKGVDFSFERGVENRVVVVNNLVTQWEQNAISRDQQGVNDLVTTSVREDTVVENTSVPALAEETHPTATTSSEPTERGRGEISYDQIMEMVQKKYRLMSGGDVIKDVLSLVSSVDKESITIDATIEGSTYRRIEIVFSENDDEEGSRF